ncbi:MAG: CHAT domain-containing protein [Planctomycetota bacterium]
MRARCLVAALLLVALGAAAPAAQESEELDAATRSALAFAGALEQFRAGTGDEAALRSAADVFGRTTGRTDAARIAAYYASLPAEARAHGLVLEQRFDALRARASGLATDEAPLRAFLDASDRAADAVPAAHAQSLFARLLARAVEDGTADAERTVEVRARALDALARFERAGMTTPTLEPLWVLGRAALTAGDAGEADRRFDELVRRAGRTGRDAWRERGLVGAIGCARERGALFRVDALLAELASFRSADSCWALAREAAVQLLVRDDVDAAERWLAAHPPVAFDAEIDRADALVEWRALLAAAALRGADAGRAERIAEELPGPIGARVRAAAALEAGRAEDALRELDGANRGGPGSRAPGEEGIDALALRGRALLRLGRTDECIEVLERARRRAQRRDSDALPGPVRASAAGEWLGLSALEALAAARAERDGALTAAAVVEATLGRTDESTAGDALLALARTTDHGAALWLVGADRTLWVHVEPDGTATHGRLELGRRDVLRAARRLRDAARATRTGPWSASDAALGASVASELLPPTLVRSLTRTKGGSLALLTRGASEEVPFELLEVGGAPLGLARALWISGPRRAPTDPAPVDGRTRWTALGAPSLEGTAFAPLPGARAELERLGDAHPAQPKLHLGADATRAAFVEALLGRAPLHVATHVVDRPGTVDRPLGGAPGRERGLVLAGGDVVTAAEIAALRPRLPLVVLAACGSADGALLDGVGPRGVAQAFLEGGTRAAIVTQWSVADGATPLGMLCLHAALAGGADPAEATRRARAALERAGAPRAEWAALRALGRP